MAKDKPFDEMTDEEVANAGTGRELEPRQARQYELVFPDGTKDSVSAIDLRGLSFNDIASHFAVATAADVLGTDQFGPILEDKALLCGVPFMLVHWEFYEGNFGGFASLWILTPDNKRYIVNDGSTGIREQLESLTQAHGVNAMVACPHGFRVSEYLYTGADGVERPAKTYYIDTKL